MTTHSLTPNDEWDTLAEREQRLLLHVDRHWLTTVDVVHRWLWPDLNQEAVRKAVCRLAEKGWLLRHPLTGREPYFVLSAKTLLRFGRRRPTKPLGFQSLLEHYAVLLACARRKSDVFTEDEFRAQFPDLTQPGSSAKNYFLDSSNGLPRLGLFLTDHDKLSSRLVNKVRSRIGKIFASDRPVFRRLILDGHFAVHVITATDGKRANLEAAFARKPPRNVPVFVEAHPELTDFFLLNRR